MKTDGESATLPCIVVQSPRQTASWIIAVALSVIATAAVLRPDIGLAQSAHAQSAAAGRPIYAFTGQLDRATSGLFMIDSDAGTVWVYEIAPANRKLKLVAARSFIYDRYLENFNPSEPTPRQVEALLEKERLAKQRAVAFGNSAANNPQAGAAEGTKGAGAATPAQSDDADVHIRVTPSGPSGGEQGADSPPDSKKSGDTEELEEVGRSNRDKP